MMYYLPPFFLSFNQSINNNNDINKNNNNENNDTLGYVNNHDTGNYRW